MSIKTMRDRLFDEEMMVEVARDAWGNVYDGPGSGEAAWFAVAKAVRDYVNYGTLRWEIEREEKQTVTTTKQPWKG